MNKILKLGSFFIAMFLMVSVAQAQKFGYVNSAALLEGMAEVKQADANLEALQKQLQKKGQGMLEQLQKDYMQIQEKVQSGDMSPKQQEEEAAKLEARQQEIAKFEQEMVSQLENKRQELLKPIYDKINKAISDVAKENGFQFIFDQGILLYADDAQDVSTMVKSKLGI